MSDLDGGAPAPVDSAPVTETPVETPAPIRDDPIPAEPTPEPESKDEKPKEPVSTREALKRAAEKVEADSKPKQEVKTDPKPVEKPRAEDGKFASAKPVETTEKPAEPVEAKPAPAPAKSVYEAPARFHAEAKAAWEAAPEPIRAEVVRLEKELTQGIDKHKAEVEPLRQYMDMAKQHGRDLPSVLQSYIQTEQEIRSNPIQGLQSMCAKLGFSLNDVVAHMTGQPADQANSQKDVELARLRSELQEVKHGLTSFKGDLESREVQQTIHTFKADPKHTRFDELQTDIGMFLQTGRANTLSEAYEMAERLNPAPKSEAPAPAASSAAPDPQAQTLKGTKSINGAPTPGSDPANRKPSTSIKESLRRAMAQAG